MCPKVMIAWQGGYWLYDLVMLSDRHNYTLRREAVGVTGEEFDAKHRPTGATFFGFASQESLLAALKLHASTLED